MQSTNKANALITIFSLLMLASSLSVSTAQAQVLGYQKISETAGGLNVEFDAFQYDEEFGRSVVSLGDLNGDGVTDLAVGGVGEDVVGGTDQGAVFILFMNPDGTVLTHRKITDGVGGFTGSLGFAHRFGTSLAPLGDLNGDGYVDLAVGSIGDNDGGVGKGAVYILFLNFKGVVIGQQKISETQGNLGQILSNNDQFGSALAPLGDVNGDGVMDLAVGARLDDTGGNASGAVYILMMNANGTVNASTKIDNPHALPNTDEHFGHALSNLGDRNGDGVPDLAAGAPRHNDGGANKGAVFILYLNANGTLQSHVHISATSGGFLAPLDSHDEFGSSISQFADVDGNGIRDLAVGAVNDDDGGLNRGAVYILHLDANEAVIDYQKISDTEGNFLAPMDDNNYFGAAVRGMGDFNGDGNEDLLVGVPGDRDNLENNASAGHGAVYLLFMDAGAGGGPRLGEATPPEVLNVSAASDAASPLKSNAYPNPFNPVTTIGYHLGQTTPVRLAVYDVLGREVAVLVNGVQQAGAHTATFEASRLPSGLYMYRLEANGTVETRSMLLAK